MYFSANWTNQIKIIMKKFLLFVVSSLVAGSTFAQMPNGSTGPDFTSTDINGNTIQLYADFLDQGIPVIMDVSATWCGPCKVLSPILEELSDEVDGVEFVKLDVDQHPEIAGANGVMGVPTVVMLKGGEVKERFVGVQPKEIIKDKVSALI